MKKSVKCANPACARTKPITFIQRLVNNDEGLERENHWYCSESCYKEAILQDYLVRKESGRELRSSTHPITARAFGAALMRMGKIDWWQLEEALDAKRRNGGLPLAHYFLERGLVTRRDIIEALSRHHHVPIATIGDAWLDQELIDMLPAPLAKLSGVIPLNYDMKQRKLSLVMKDPSDLTTILTIRRLLDCNIQAFQGDPAEIDRLLNRHYSKEKFVKSSVSDNKISRQLVMAH